MKTFPSILSLVIIVSLLSLGCGQRKVVKSPREQKLAYASRSTVQEIKNAKDKKSRDKKASDKKANARPARHQSTEEKIRYRTALALLNHGKVQECLDHLKPLVALEDPKALYLTGRCYECYSLINNQKTADWYFQRSLPGLRKLEAVGDPEATYYLGRYELKKGSTLAGNQKIKKVWPHLLVKAREGDETSQQRLGCIYYFGWGIKEDKSKAYYWFRKCANSGSGFVYSNYIIGYMYRKGENNIKPSPTHSRKYFLAAAKKGFAPAQMELGFQLYYSGNPNEKETGRAWLDIAKKKKEPNAIKILASIDAQNSTASRGTIGRAKRVVKAPRTQAEIKNFAKTVSRAVGEKIMESIGGGQDLVVTVRAIDYDSIQGEFEIDILVSFNGIIFSSDNYRVAGRITVRKDGTGARFAKTAANANFKEWESTITALAFTAIVIEALDESSGK